MSDNLKQHYYNLNSPEAISQEIEKVNDKIGIYKHKTQEELSAVLEFLQHKLSHLEQRRYAQHKRPLAERSRINKIIDTMKKLPKDQERIFSILDELKEVDVQKILIDVMQGDKIGDTLYVLKMDNKEYIFDLYEKEIKDVTGEIKKGDDGNYYYINKANEKYRLIDVNDSKYEQLFENAEVYEQKKYSQVYALSDNIPSDFVFKNILNVDGGQHEEVSYGGIDDPIGAGSHLVVCPTGEVMLLKPGMLDKMKKENYKPISQEEANTVEDLYNDIYIPQMVSDKDNRFQMSQVYEYNKVMKYVQGNPEYFVVEEQGRKALDVEEDVCAFKRGGFQTALGKNEGEVKYKLVKTGSGTYFIEKRAFDLTHQKQYLTEK